MACCGTAAVIGACTSAAIATSSHRHSLRGSQLIQAALNIKIVTGIATASAACRCARRLAATTATASTSANQDGAVVCLACRFGPSARAGKNLYIHAATTLRKRCKNLLRSGRIESTS